MGDMKETSDNSNTAAILLTKFVLGEYVKREIGIVDTFFFKI